MILYTITDWLWANVIGYALLAVGAYFTIRLGLPQIRHFSRSIKTMQRSIQSATGGVSGFGTLMAALGGQLGTGSLVGVGSALAMGGPGAIFWMWMTAIFGMVITFSETLLGQAFRQKDPQSGYTGGPSYYIERGLRSKALSIFMAALYVLGVGIAIASIQTHSIANSFSQIVSISPLIPGVIVIALALFITIGGMQRLANVSTYVVPSMVIVYFSIVMLIVVTNLPQVPGVFSSIVTSAFTPQSAAGGVIGWTVAEAFRNGVARGMFSNDAGNGVAAIMHASADVRHPVDQGMLGMMGTFITTIIICTCTALAILLTGALETGNAGVLLLQSAFGEVLGVAGAWIVFFAMFLFGFTTLVADIHYGEAGLKYIFRKKHNTAIWLYRIILTIVLLFSCVVELKAIWASIDLLVGLIVLINIIALTLLFKYVRYIYKDYFSQLDQGINQPIWNYDEDIIERVKK
ncbi:alanine/glycine:cation symporter family protein [Thauera sp. SDU_THAU2]|uniref:alanine/glycine:cation symporter family protein n=1 Tax=Thauera sp. SDU_THAU2 TaxID=3136633 RepID=UPI003120047B